jgi:hypothetical protein
LWTMRSRTASAMVGCLGHRHSRGDQESVNLRRQYPATNGSEPYTYVDILVASYRHRRNHTRSATSLIQRIGRRAGRHKPAPSRSRGFHSWPTTGAGKKLSNKSADYTASEFVETVGVQRWPTSPTLDWPLLWRGQQHEVLATRAAWLHRLPTLYPNLRGLARHSSRSTVGSAWQNRTALLPDHSSAGTPPPSRCRSKRSRHKRR